MTLSLTKVCYKALTFFDRKILLGKNHRLPLIKFEVFITELFLLILFCYMLLILSDSILQEELNKILVSTLILSISGWLLLKPMMQNLTKLTAEGRRKRQKQIFKKNNHV